MGDWVDVVAKESVAEGTKSSTRKETNWMFEFEMTQQFGGRVTKAYQDSLRQAQQDSGEADNDKQTYVRLHSEMKNQKS